MLIHNQLLTHDFMIEVVGVLFGYKESYRIAERKGRNVSFWSLLFFLFSPVFVILYSCRSGKRKKLHYFGIHLL
ncbi:unnamed protein product [Commensalibacter communis]|nr:unnamed protein product [Commensalibacter communis]CAI3956442.1 unnamed protein product [Commensalibacter communis]